MNFRLFAINAVFAVYSAKSSQIFVAPYNFSLNPNTHQLHTTWEVKESSISFICAFAEVSLMELSWTGESKELRSGNSWAVNCEEGELGDKMVIEVDVTKFRVQPFKSYQVCISLEDSSTDSHLDEVCTHLFSFEKYVPYVPHDEEIEDNSVAEPNKLSVNKKNVKSHKDSEKDKSDSEKISKNSVAKSFKQKLEDIENFVRDDYRTSFLNSEDKTELELSLAILDEIDFEMKDSSSGKNSFSILMMLCAVLFLIN